MAGRTNTISIRRISRVLQLVLPAMLIVALCLLAWPAIVSAYVDPQETIVLPKKGGATSRAALQRGKVIGQFAVPRLKLFYVLLEGTDNRTLDKSIGHVEGTGLPGQSGNISIAGHRNTHFRKLEWIRRGDDIVITSPTGQYRYRVEWARLFRPTDMAVLDASHGPAVTLITCFPFEYVGAAPLRYVIRALPDDETRSRLSTSSASASLSRQ